MNTPKPTTNHTNENQQRNSDILETQLAQTYIQTLKRRDYGRILHGYNIPAQWYQGSPRTSSIYYYDPQYQRTLQQYKQPTKIPFILPPSQLSNQSKSLSKYSLNTSKINLPSRLQSVPTLPPITLQKKANNE